MKSTFSASRRGLLTAGGGALALAAAGTWLGTRGARPTGLHVFQGPTMASSYTVKLNAPGLDAGGVAEAHAAVESELGHLVARMSSFEPGSELSRFNRHASERPVAVSPELAQVLTAARSVSEASDGQFDVTIAPVVDAWGFGPRGMRGRPATDDLARAREAVNWRALELDAARGTLAKGHPRLAIDLSGIAQGHGADRVAQALERLGFTDYLVDICGEMRARGLNGHRQPWRVGIERPDTPTRTAHRIVALDRGALATSGDYRIYFEQDGKRYSHEIDPRTGAPARHALASVSVVAADAASADAWATALFVAGPQAGYELAVAQGLAAYFIERRAGDLAERLTPAFAALPSERA
jgi:thiamine biosynthesis lipoprotein